MPFPTIRISPPKGEAPIVTLRPVTADAINHLLPADPEAIANMTVGDRSILRQPAPYVLAELQEEGSLTWGIHIGKDERAVGVANLGDVGDAWQDVGIAILDKAQQRKGVGYMTILGIATYAFERADCELLLAEPLVGNEPINKVLRRVGFLCCSSGNYGQGRTYTWVLPSSVDKDKTITPRQSLADITATRQTFKDAGLHYAVSVDQADL